MFLTCPDEVYKYVGATFLDALAQPAVGARLAEHPVRLRFGVVDPDCVLYIDTERREVHFGGPTDAPISGMVAMNGDTAIKYCQGRLDVDDALATGEIAAAGDCRVLLDALSTASALPVVYAEVLRREGRSDLLAPELSRAG